MLVGKRALVTGASRGIGAAIARRLSAEGAEVIVNYTSSAAAASTLVKEIGQQGGVATSIQADVSVPADITRLFDEVSARFGHLDILVNNAGIAQPALLDQVTPESIDQQFALNVKGLLLATQAAVRLFPESGGVVVNLSSGGPSPPSPTCRSIPRPKAQSMC